MKKTLCLFSLIALMGFSLPTFAQDSIFEHDFQSGLFSNPFVTEWNQLFVTNFPAPSPTVEPLLSSQVVDFLGLIQIVSVRLVGPPLGLPLGFGRISGNPDNGSPFLFFSRVPGDIAWSAGRPGCSIQGQNIAWKSSVASHPQTDRCILEPGQVYYFNVGYFDGALARQGLIIDVCHPPPQPASYSVSCAWRASHGLGN